MAPGDKRRAASSPRTAAERSRLVVAVSDERGKRIRAGLGVWLAATAPSRARGLVNVAIVPDTVVRRLNRQHRRIDKATDVLSFPSPSAPARTAPAFLGDIVIAHGVARRQAQQVGHSEATELKVLALHGLLHLLGYDHERDSGTMARLERRLRHKGGLREGLIERH